MGTLKGMFNNWAVVLVLCATLGFAPYFPEPHLFNRYRWWYYGGAGMMPVDYMDLLMHASPFFMLLRLMVLAVWKYFTQKKSAHVAES